MWKSVQRKIQYWYKWRKCNSNFLTLAFTSYMISNIYIPFPALPSFFPPKKDSCNDLWNKTLILSTWHCHNWIFPAYYVWHHKVLIHTWKMSPSYLLINKLCQLQYSLTASLNKTKLNDPSTKKHCKILSSALTPHSSLPANVKINMSRTNQLPNVCDNWPIEV